MSSNINEMDSLRLLDISADIINETPKKKPTVFVEDTVKCIAIITSVIA